MTRSWLGIGVGVALAALALLPAVGASAPGDLVVQGCVGDDGSRGCTTVPSLRGASSVVVGPSGASAYVASPNDASVTQLARDAEGRLFDRGCVGDGNAVCTQVDSLTGAWSVVVSPDGRSAYVASERDDTVTHLALDAEGRLFDRGCVGDENPVCTQVDSLEKPGDLAISPDGRSLYVPALDDDAVTHLSIDAEGRLTFRGCVGDGNPGCTQVDSLDGPRAVAVSPDGGAVYVASPTGDSVTHLSRDAAGGLVNRGCVGAPGSGCTQVDSLDEPRALAVSGDGAALYVASFAGDSVTHLARDAAGRLFDRGCVGDRNPSCTQVPSLDGPVSLALSPDGASLYVASHGDSAVTHLARDSEGRLVDRGCVGDGTPECRQVGSLLLAASVAVSPDGRAVYAAAPGRSSVTHFAREVASPPAGGPGTPPAGGAAGGGASGGGTPAPPVSPGGTPSTGSVFCGDRRATLVARGPTTVGTAGRDVIVGLGVADRIDAGAGDDVVCGAGGADQIRGGPGADRLSGEAGVDALRGGPGPDVLSGGAGADRLLGNAGRDLLIGGPGNDRLLGGPDRDRLIGGGGVDRLSQ